MLKGALHTKSHSLIKSPLVTNDVSSVLRKKGLPSVEGAGHKERRELLLPAFSHVHVKGLVPGLWPKGVETTEKIAEVVCASRSGAGGEEGVEVGRWYLLATPDVIGSSDFGYEFRALESAFQAGVAIPRKSSTPSQQTHTSNR